MLAAILRLIRNTHRHPTNQALHFIGAPFYVTGLMILIGYFTGVQVNPLIGIAMWISAVAMFMAGHNIEGNLRTMTPVLVVRLLSRKAASYHVSNRIHFLRA